MVFFSFVYSIVSRSPSHAHTAYAYTLVNHDRNTIPSPQHTSIRLSNDSSTPTDQCRVYFFSIFFGLISIAIHRTTLTRARLDSTHTHNVQAIRHVAQPSLDPYHGSARCTTCISWIRHGCLDLRLVVGRQQGLWQQRPRRPPRPPRRRCWRTQADRPPLETLSPTRTARPREYDRTPICASIHISIEC